MNAKIAVVAIIALAALSASLSALRAQAGSRTNWDGVYTEEQAKRGEALYTDSCASCHGKALEGDGESAPLAGGSKPLWTYDGKPLTALFDRINKDMPPADPGSMSAEQSADLLAYILAFNKFPAGQTELPHDAAALNQIHYQSTNPKDSKK